MRIGCQRVDISMEEAAWYIHWWNEEQEMIRAEMGKAK